MELGVVAGVVLIGFVHGVLPDHGWPIAATYALNRNRRLFYGFLAALILGVGHLFSSVVLVLAYFWFSTFAAFAEGPWMRYLAGALLILLGIREYRHGSHELHGHEHDDDHSHDHADGPSHEYADGHHHGHDHHDDSPADAHPNGGDVQQSEAHDNYHSHDHHDNYYSHDHHDDHENPGLFERIRLVLPGGEHRHLEEAHAERGLYALGMTALLLGFAHEEPIQILAICVGTDFCLELMLVYSLAVIVAIVVPTLLLIAGYERSQERIERLTPYLPTITALALVGMGSAFIFGLI